MRLRAAVWYWRRTLILSVAIKGVFGVPLELLVEREGSDSLLGATRATLRVPSFIDDVISAMRQMGMCAMNSDLGCILTSTAL